MFEINEYALTNNITEINLNLGSGGRPIENWINIDNYDYEKNDMYNKTLASKVDNINYVLPSVTLLKEYTNNKSSINLLEKVAKEKGKTLTEALASFKLNVKLANIHIGPNVTKYELIPEQLIRENTCTSDNFFKPNKLLPKSKSSSVKLISKRLPNSILFFFGILEKRISLFLTFFKFLFLFSLKKSLF